MTRLGAHDVIALLADPASWHSWDRPPTQVTADSQYAEDLACARAKTGLDEAVITGVATIRGRRIAMLVCDFGFLGGSIGIAASDRLAAAIRRATAEKLPLLALPTSGGTRMQEGTTAFLQMVKITSAVVAHKSRAPAVSGLSARPHHRWSVRLVGLTGTRHLRRTRRLGRFSRASSVRSALRQPVSHRCADLGKPLRLRTHRRGHSCCTNSATWWTAR